MYRKFHKAKFLLFVKYILLIKLVVIVGAVYTVEKALKRLMIYEITC